MDHFFGYIFYFFGRYPGIDAPGFANSILQYDGPRSNDRIAVDHRIVHHDRSHTDQHIIMEGTAMNNGMMSYRNIIPNCCAISPESTMDAGAVLHIYFIADPDKVNITPDNGIEPETAIIPGDHITHNSGIGSNKTVIAELRMFIFYREYYRHVLFFCYQLQFFMASFLASHSSSSGSLLSLGKMGR